MIVRMRTYNNNIMIIELVSGLLCLAYYWSRQYNISYSMLIQKIFLNS